MEQWQRCSEEKMHDVSEDGNGSPPIAPSEDVREAPGADLRLGVCAAKIRHGDPVASTRLLRVIERFNVVFCMATEEVSAVMQ